MTQAQNIGGFYADLVADGVLDHDSWDDVEVHPVLVEEDGTVHCLDDDGSDANCWSAYVHLVTGGIECVGDFDTLIEATEYADRLMDDKRRRDGDL